MPEAVVVDGLDWVHGTAQPLDGTASVDLVGWEQRALRDREVFARDLRSMGLGDDEISQGIAVRDDAQADVNASVKAFWDAHHARARRYYRTTPPEVGAQARLVSNSATGKAWQRLRDWWAEFTTSASSERKLGWALTIGAAGLSAEAKVTVLVCAASPR
jgi:hypothetical protein